MGALMQYKDAFRLAIPYASGITPEEAACLQDAYCDGDEQAVMVREWQGLEKQSVAQHVLNIYTGISNARASGAGLGVHQTSPFGVVSAQRHIKARQTLLQQIKDIEDIVQQQNYPIGAKYRIRALLHAATDEISRAKT